jgi:hypothetical protein
MKIYENIAVLLAFVSNASPLSDDQNQLNSVDSPRLPVRLCSRFSEFGFTHI